MLVPLPDCLKLQVLLVAEVAAVDGNLWVASACGTLSILSGNFFLFNQSQISLNKFFSINPKPIYFSCTEFIDYHVNNTSPFAYKSSSSSS
jgi:hypothetical protein